MKIAVLSDTFPPRGSGGADAVAFALAKALKKRGHEMIVITTSRDPQDAGERLVEGLTVHTIATAYDLRFQAYVSLWNVPVARRVRRILSDFKPDVVHAHNVHAYLSYRSLIAAKRLGAHVILTAHDVMTFNYGKLTSFINPNDLSVPTAFNYRVSAWQQLREQRFRYNPLRNFLIRRTLRQSVDRIVAVSDALKQALADNGIGNVQTIHNGIDVREWEEPVEDIADFKRAHRIGDSAILFGGRLSGVKGAVNIIKALARIVSEVPEAELLILGQKDAYADRMLALARDLGIIDKLIFTGWIEGRTLHQAYYAAAVVAVPSLCFDSFPTMNLEAMACGKPIVATCFGGSREAVEDGTTGYIVNPSDIETLAAKLIDLLSNPSKSRAMGAAGRARVSTEFTVGEQAAAYEKLFRVV
ncbi:glycosyltransferase family 4 protein [Patescibacteria group bacterium]|nr:glycosyltransferase family 4 protein [Patescibacteria group bacterium]